MRGDQPRCGHDRSHRRRLHGVGGIATSGIGHEDVIAILLAVITANMAYSALRGSSRRDVHGAVFLLKIVEIAAIGAGIATNKFRAPSLLCLAAVMFAAVAALRIGPVWRSAASPG
jgi:hypothetical protein